MVASMGLRTMLAEGAKHVLGWKSPNYVYANAIDQKLHLLLRNFKLSDDIAFRFSDRGWSQWPLTAEKYVSWLNNPELPGEVINLFMDYETFGEHQKADSGIFEFMKHLPNAALATGSLKFATPTEVSKSSSRWLSCTLPTRFRGPTRSGTLRPGSATNSRTKRSKNFMR